MFRKLAVVLACTGLLATSASAASFLRAKGSFSTFLSSLKYDPSSSCTKPYRPYQMDKWAREQYIRGGEAYLTCMREAANSDIEYAQEVIRDGYREAANDFLEEVRRGY